MYEFEPIAIVGLGAVAQDCFSYKDFWSALHQGELLLSDLSQIDPRQYKKLLHHDAGVYVKDKTWTLAGGFVNNFDKVFDQELFLKNPDYNLTELDMIYQWSMMSAFEAINSVCGVDDEVKKNAGIIMGNTAMPSELFSKYAASVYFKNIHNLQPSVNKVHPLNRFIPGSVARVVANSLGLGGHALALDAACASGVYSIKLACDYLHSGKADLMLAGSVNAVARPMLHVAFSILGALSHSGQTRPFNKAADGILPSEGASFVALKRLADAEECGDKIFGVIRGIGLSNSGREGNFLAPSVQGEALCIKRAYAQSTIKPEEVAYLECHATGTIIGDGVEVQALKEVFGAESSLVLSSLKANVGHMMSNAGIASVIRTLGCFESDYLPMTPNTETLLDSFADTNFNVLQKNADWRGRKVAGINSFGLGGCNAHMILESPASPPEIKKSSKKSSKVSVEQAKIAIVGVGIKAAFADNIHDFSKLLFSEQQDATEKRQGQLSEIEIDPKRAFVPPVDLKNTQGQQLILLPALEEALSSLAEFDKETVGVFVGMETDPESARYLINMRLDYFAKEFGITAQDITMAELQQAMSPPLDSSNTVGVLSHLMASRINHVLNCHGQSMTISAGEISGDMAIKSAIIALQKGEISTAIVGAADLSREVVHEAACAEISSLSARHSSDAAVVFILKKLDQAIADNSNILAVIADEADSSGCESIASFSDFLNERHGCAHSVLGALNILSAVLYVNTGFKFDFSAGIVRQLQKNTDGLIAGHIENVNFLGEKQCWKIIAQHANKNIEPSLLNDLYVFCFSSATRQGLIDDIKENRQHTTQQHRLAFICRKNEYFQKKSQALSLLESLKTSSSWAHSDVIYNSSYCQGKLGFVFTGSASAYAGAARGLPLNNYSLLKYVQDKKLVFQNLPEYAFNKVSRSLKAVEQTVITNILSQAHAAFLLNVLLVKPDVALGLSQGEAEAFYAFGVWENAQILADDIEKFGLYNNNLSGSFELAKQYWETEDNAAIAWKNYFVSGSVALLNDQIDNFKKVYVLIEYTDNQCVIGGDATACGMLLARLTEHTYTEVFYDLIFHCPVAKLYSETLYKLYSRECCAVSDVKFYSNHFGGQYELSSESIAQAIVGQATEKISFPGVVKSAWDNGVRCFIELGPKSSLASSIGSILQGKEHYVVAMDVESKDSFGQMLHASAYLWCLGIPFDIDKIMLQSDKFQSMLGTTNINIHARLPEVGQVLVTNSTDVSNASIKSMTQPVEKIGQPMNVVGANIASVHQSYLQIQKNMLDRYHGLSKDIIRWLQQ